MNDKEKSVLVVIDLQNDFTQKDGKANACTSQVDETVPKINQLIDNFESRDIDVVYFKTEWKNLILKLLTKNSVKVGSHGAELDARLTSLNKSIFIKNNKNIFSNKRFLKYLNDNKIKKIYLSGLAVEHCLNISFKESKKLNLQTSIISDAVISYKCTEITSLLSQYFPSENLVVIDDLTRQ